MTVHFIGAGPGAPDLITVRGLRLIQRCPVCLYAGSLVPANVVAETPPRARVVDTSSMHLDEIMAEIQAAHAQGHDVTRVHSGDPSLYGTIAEQIRRLDALGIGWTITPGVPAFAAAAAALGRELTLPGIAQSVVVTRTAVRASAMPPGENLTALAATGATLCIHLSINNLASIVRELVPILGEDMPVAVVHRATWPDQKILRGTLADIRSQVKASGITRTALILVGRVLGDAVFSESRLYAADHSHVLRPRTQASHAIASGTEPEAPAGG
jgi:precorrin-4/cobalt-precorrin-4 C11-methyltransferase